jgi:hypothetical protein
MWRDVFSCAGEGSRGVMKMAAAIRVDRSPVNEVAIGHDIAHSCFALVHRIIQLIQLDTLPRFPGEGRDPLLPWAPAFSGVAGLVWAMARHCLMNRVNDSLH